MPLEAFVVFEGEGEATGGDCDNIFARSCGPDLCTCSAYGVSGEDCLRVTVQSRW